MVKNMVFVLLFLSSFICGQESLFPKINGWQLTVEKQVYDSNNLWDLIDGAADLFLEYSFVDLHYARYTGANNMEVKAEIYKHATPLDAFGIYSQERDPGNKFIQTGAQGYIDEGILNFLDGIFYIKLSTLQKDEAAQKALLLVAKELDNSLKQENSFPKVLNSFPAKGKLPNSEKYVAQNFMGHSFLKSVITAKYEDKIPFTAFIINAEKPENALKVLEQFLSAMNSSNPVKIGSNGYQINDTQTGLIDIIQQNQFIYGAINCTDKVKKDNLMYEIKNSLEIK